MASGIKKLPAQSDLIPLFITLASVLVIIFIPLRIMGYGFLPIDDVLRHAAKAISGRDWNDVLVLREGISMDSHPGYHALLGLFYSITKCRPDMLVFSAISALFIAFCLAPLFFVRRQEAWLAALLAITLTDFSFVTRLLIGRPYIITMATLLVLCLIWPRLKDAKMPYGAMSLITALIALATWIHCSWYLFIFASLAFLLAREWRVFTRMAACAVAGVLLGALLTGLPILFLKQNLMHAFLAFSRHALPRTLAIEFRPLTGELPTVIFVSFMLLWRQARGRWDIKSIDNPVFILALLGWILGFFVGRFWYDWGVPALLVWMAREFEDIFEGCAPFFSLRRLILTLAIVAVLYPAVTNDVNNRWSEQPAAEYLFKDSEEKASWMPDPGGIIYSDDLRVFFLTFYKNPYAPWRYMVGFEPALMPEKDLDIFLNIHMTRSAAKSFSPWIDKMKPADRLAVTPQQEGPPKIAELEWYYAGSGLWMGRLPRTKAK